MKGNYWIEMTQLKKDWSRQWFVFCKSLLTNYFLRLFWLLKYLLYSGSTVIYLVCKKHLVAPAMKFLPSGTSENWNLRKC